ncbi:MAG: hypothetical protein KDB27_21810 [Planctomycetales bacterium]|nr:hypothetical protein [Planctomycetales bacterium]
MNLIGKIFIVLIAVMSIFFMALAMAVYSTHQNWKTMAQAEQERHRTLQRENDELAAKNQQLLDTAAIERAARTKAIATSETRLLQSQQQLQQARTQLNTLQEEHNTAIKSVSLAQSQLEQLKGQITTLRDTITKAQNDRDDQFARVRELTDLINQAEGTKAALERRLQQLTDQYSQAQNVLKAHSLTINTPVHNIPPRLEGVVQAADASMIEISLGSDEGLQKGHTVEVSRGDRYLGRARIIRVENDISVGQLLKEFSKAPIRKGDRVQTKVR